MQNVLCYMGNDSSEASTIITTLANYAYEHDCCERSATSLVVYNNKEAYRKGVDLSGKKACNFYVLDILLHEFDDRYKTYENPLERYMYDIEDNYLFPSDNNVFIIKAYLDPLDKERFSKLRPTLSMHVANYLCKNNKPCFIIMNPGTYTMYRKAWKQVFTEWFKTDCPVCICANDLYESSFVPKVCECVLENFT